MHFATELMDLELIGLPSVENVPILGTSYLAIIQRGRVGHLSSSFIKSNQAILLNLVDFELKKQSEDNNLMAATSPLVLV